MLLLLLLLEIFPQLNQSNLTLLIRNYYSLYIFFRSKSFISKRFLEINSKRIAYTSKDTKLNKKKINESYHYSQSWYNKKISGNFLCCCFCSYMKKMNIIHFCLLACLLDDVFYLHYNSRFV